MITIQIGIYNLNHLLLALCLGSLFLFAIIVGDLIFVPIVPTWIEESNKTDKTVKTGSDVIDVANPTLDVIARTLQMMKVAATTTAVKVIEAEIKEEDIDLIYVETSNIY